MPKRYAFALDTLRQLALDFFAAPAPTTAQNSPQNAPKTEATQADFTPQKPKKILKLTQKDPHALAALEQPTLAHPQATHRIRLNGQLLAYQLVRSSRRTVGFMVGADGLRVRASSRVSLAEIERLLQERADWILKHWQAQQQKQAAAVPEAWADGSCHDLHGQGIVLQLNPALPRGQAQLIDGNGDGVLQPFLQLALPADANSAAIEQAALRWYGRYAHAHFSQRLAHYAPLLGVTWRSLRLSSAKTRWGSAKADGSIRLHWRLVQLAPELLDYVVVHELAHLHEMNHSPRFWAIVAQHCPDYLALRKRLRSHSL